MTQKYSFWSWWWGNNCWRFIEILDRICRQSRNKFDWWYRETNIVWFKCLEWSPKLILLSMSKLLDQKYLENVFDLWNILISFAMSTKCRVVCDCWCCCLSDLSCLEYLIYLMLLKVTGQNVNLNLSVSPLNLKCLSWIRINRRLLFVRFL